MTKDRGDWAVVALTALFIVVITAVVFGIVVVVMTR